MKVKQTIRRFLPRAIRKHTILAGPLRGRRIFTSWHDYPAAILGQTERPLLDWFARNVGRGETWLDVGAHYGYTAIALSRLVGPTGRVFAFEPMLSTAGYLAQTRLFNSLSHLTVLPFALGAPMGFELSELPTTRGMVDSTLGDASTGPDVFKEIVLVARLDWLWPQICGENRQIDGVKIDVQGMEIEVLRGMADMLQRYRPRIVVEVHQAVDRNELLSVVESSGYSRQSLPIEPIKGEIEAQYFNDRSYAFEAR